MLNYELMYKGLIDFTKAVVGSRLSETQLQVGTTPSVSKARTSRNEVGTPYITIDLGRTIEPLGHLKNAYLDEITNLPTYEKFYEVFFTWRCYGKDSESILQQLQGSLSLPFAMNYICTNTGGLTLHDRGSIIPAPTLLSTKYREGANITASFYITDVIVDTLQEGDYIVTIDGDQCLVSGAGGDIESPFEVTKP
mgnify:CR=1 FL=1